MSDRQNNKPSIGALSFALRHRELWPDHFHWDYSACETCALALASLTWPKHIVWPDPHMVMQALGMKEKDAMRIFRGAGDALKLSNRSVTPEHIADMLDELQ